MVHHEEPKHYHDVTTKIVDSVSKCYGYETVEHEGFTMYSGLSEYQKYGSDPLFSCYRLFKSTDKLIRPHDYSVGLDPSCEIIPINDVFTLVYSKTFHNWKLYKYTSTFGKLSCPNTKTKTEKLIGYEEYVTFDGEEHDLDYIKTSDNVIKDIYALWNKYNSSGSTCSITNTWLDYYGYTIEEKYVTIVSHWEHVERWTFS